MILPQQSHGLRAASSDHAQEKMLGADEFLIERARLVLGRLQRGFGGVAERLVHGVMITVGRAHCRISLCSQANHVQIRISLPGKESEMSAHRKWSRSGIVAIVQSLEK